MTLVLVLLLQYQPSPLPGPTVEFPSVRCIGEQPAAETRAEWQATVSRPALAPAAPQGRDDWWFIDSLRICGELAPGSRVIVSLPHGWWSIEPVETLDLLPPECRAALDYSPAWLREELTSAFRRLGDSAAVWYAGLLLAVPDPCVDEVAFCIATMGPEVLLHRLFNPDLLLVNAEQLYQIDDSLQFADIVDRGSRPGDYYSTVRYRVQQGPDTVWVELPRDIYYYYVVHPITSDELPRLDDYVYNMHWREYFFFCADSGFPVLQDYAKRAKVVWFREQQNLPAGRPFLPSDCALDVIGNWVTRTNIAGASGNRPIHPNVIAHEHNGNCGEIQDLWTAACRTCLIPTVNCSDPCEDHVWNEFWDGYWRPLASDPSTRIADSGVAYEEAHGGSKRISGVFNWRSDGYWWTVTSHFSNYCSLYVRILDALGRPMDGCRVLIYSEGWYGGLSVSTGTCTDALGAARFELGDLRNFYVQVQTPFGTWPDANSSVRVITTSQTGARYFSTLYLPYVLDAPRPEPVSYPPPDSTYVGMLFADAQVRSEMDYGYSVTRGAGTGDPDDSVRIFRYYSDKHPSGTLDFFALDSAGYRGYSAGGRFAALLSGDNVPPQYVCFHAPDRQAPGWFALSSEDKLFSSRWLDVRFELWHYSSGIHAEHTSPPGRLDCPTIVRDRLPVSFPQVPESSPPRLLSIFSSSGRLVLSLPCLPSADYRLPSSLPAGTYFLRFSSPAGSATHRFVVVR